MFDGSRKHAKDSSEDDRYLRVDYSEERGLFARMTTFGTHGPGEFIGRVSVWRPDRRSLKVRFPKRYLGRNLARELQMGCDR